MKALLCEGLIECYPTGQIFFTHWTVPGFSGSQSEEVEDATLEACRNYGIPVFDSARRSGMYISNETFRTTFLQPPKRKQDRYGVLITVNEINLNSNL